MGRIELDIEEWTRVGGELLEAAPKDFLLLLEAAKRIAAVHSNPLSVPLEECQVPGSGSSRSASDSR